MQYCDACDSPVSDEFARVFVPDHVEAIPACPECATKAGIASTVAERTRRT